MVLEFCPQRRNGRVKPVNAQECVERGEELVRRGLKHAGLQVILPLELLGAVYELLLVKPRDCVYLGLKLCCLCLEALLFLLFLSCQEIYHALPVFHVRQLRLVEALEFPLVPFLERSQLLLALLFEDLQLLLFRRFSLHFRGLIWEWV